MVVDIKQREHLSRRTNLELFSDVIFMSVIRKTTVAGMFYEQHANELEDQINQCFTHEMGPGELDIPKKANQNVIGVIVPHAGFVCSGPFAAYSYHTLAKEGFADTFILIGPNHSGVGPNVAVDPSGVWETPFGPLSIDEDIALKLSSSTIITADAQTLKKQENSLEVQLPFIKYLSNKLQKNCSIVPIIMARQDLQTSIDVGEEIAKILKNGNKNISIIASTDFSHEGYSYGRIPPAGLSADNFARKQDRHALDAIQQKNPELLFENIRTYGISMCGFGPVISLLTVAKKHANSTVELLKYGTSYDTCSDSNTCVGYAAFAIKK